MGVVYLAHDTRLGRDVALKFLPQRATLDPEHVRRFAQEARAASALNHPNILTIYDVGESDGSRFLATEYVEGETLRERIRRARPTLRESVQIATQIAAALGAAHRAGIIHRDIKPENVMLRADGLVKVVDFGLAKLTETAKSSEAVTLMKADTIAGVVLGTVRYMSPEQARGLPATAASDVFSLGVVLYELVSGRQPFRGETPTDVIVSILQTQPAPLTTLAPGVPEELQRITDKALAKEPERRYASCVDLAEDLRRLLQRLENDSDAVTTALTPARPARRFQSLAIALAALVVIAGVIALALRSWRASEPKIATLAVLPFANSGTDASMEYLSDGVTESLINHLAHLPNLKVMSRSAVWRYRKREADPREVGRELNVQAVLVGRVAQRGERLSISAELIDARDNTQLWGEQYDRSAHEVLGVQREIASSILESLRVKLTGEDKRLMEKRQPRNPEAYERYIRGRYHLNKRSADAIRKGRDFFQAAIAEDPAYALAYAGISDAYALLVAQAAMPASEAYPAALSAARKAIELDDRLAEGHASLAHAAFHVGDYETATREFARAQALDPTYLPAFQWQAEFLNAVGRREEAFAATRKALSIDPLDLATNAQLATLLIAGGKSEEARVQLLKTLEIDPDYFYAHALLGTVYTQMKRYPEAIAEFQEVERLTNGARGKGGLALAYAAAGRKDDARRVVAEMEARSKEHYVEPMEIARVHAALRNADATLEWLGKAAHENPAATHRIERDEQFAFLRNDVRFAAIVRPR